MIRPAVLALATSLALTLPVHAQAPKVLRYAFPVAETGFDPAQISDLYSRTIAANIFDAPLQFVVELLDRGIRGLEFTDARFQLQSKLASLDAPRHDSP